MHRSTFLPLQHAATLISSVDWGLGKFLGIRQATAWHLEHRLREVWADNPRILGGVVEIDETYMGGREKNKYADKKLHAGRGAVGKTTVVGGRSRDGLVKIEKVGGNDKGTLHGWINDNVANETIVYTDEHRAYPGMPKAKKHRTVTHSKGHYVDGDCHTNGIESVWAVLKREAMGTFHRMTPKHLQRYLDELAWKQSNMKKTPMDKSDINAKVIIYDTQDRIRAIIVPPIPPVRPNEEWILDPGMYVADVFIYANRIVTVKAKIPIAAASHRNLDVCIWSTHPKDKPDIVGCSKLQVSK